MAKIDLDGDGKADVSVNIQQIIALVTLIVSIAGSYYTLKNRIESNEMLIQRAMEMPKQDVSKKDIEAIKREFDLKLSKIERQAEENMNDIKFIESNYRRNR